MCERGGLEIMKLLLHYLYTIINHSLVGQVTGGNTGTGIEKVCAR